MINIYESQYQKDDRNNSQERFISYSSFDDYTSDLLNDKIKLQYPSLPRQCKINKHIIDGNAITLEFEHPIFRHTVIHTAFVTNS
jgi:hypothetical protein